MTYQEQLTRYDALVARCERFERKGKTMPYTSANGHMFSLLNKAGELGIRFSRKTQEAYFEELATEQFMSYGSKMQGYILIHEELMKDETRVLDLLNESYDYVMSLDPK